MSISVPFGAVELPYGLQAPGFPPLRTACLGGGPPRRVGSLPGRVTSTPKTRACPRRATGSPHRQRLPRARSCPHRRLSPHHVLCVPRHRPPALSRLPVGGSPSGGGLPLLRSRAV